MYNIYAIRSTRTVQNVESRAKQAVTDVEDDTDELRYAMEHHQKGQPYCQQLQQLSQTVMVDHVDINNLADVMDLCSDSEEDGALTDPASEGEGMDIDLLEPQPQVGGQRLTRQACVHLYVV
jgi:hypothetical protein